jgi:subtilase family serine protease
MNPAPTAVLALALVLLAPAGALTVGHAPGSAAASPPRVLSLASDAVAVPAGVVAQPVAGTSDVTLTFSLRTSDPSGLAQLLAAQQDPASPEYRHFLSEPEFAREYEPSPTALVTVESGLRGAGGGSIVPTPDRLGVGAEFSVASAEALLGVRMVAYPTPAGGFAYTSVGTPRLPAALASLVSGVDGLAGGSVAAPSGLSVVDPPSPVGGSPSQFVGSGAGSPVDWYVGSDFAQAYNATQLWPGNGSVPNATYPTHLAIATLLASGYDANNSTVLPPWDPTVVEAYFNDTLAPGWPHPNVTGVPVNVSGAPNPPPPPGSFHGATDSSLDEYENSLDLEMAGSLAPGSSLYNFYFSGAVLANPLTSLSDVANDFADDLAAALSYDYAPANLTAVSCSFGLPDLNDSLWDTELLHSAAIGVTVVAASGDQGDAPAALTGRGESPSPLWPATAAFNTSGVMSVGGATVVVGGTPTATYNGSPLEPTFDANVTGVNGTSVWYDTSQGPGNYAGTEGGISSVYPEPYWQLHSAAQPEIANTSVLEGATYLGRAGPDVGFPANRTIAYVFANVTNVIFFTILEGTSVAAPLCAGLLTDVVAVLSSRAGQFAPLGFVDPTLYRIASFYANATASASAVPSNPFLPVTTGRNYAFPATPGWDALTGWGGFDPARLLEAYSNATIANYQYTGPIPLPPFPNPTPSTPWPYTYVIVGLGGVGVVLILAVALVTSSRPPAVRSVPAAAPAAGPAPTFPGAPAVRGYTGPTFLCPYCGAARPAEPTRCPSCGSL